MNRWIRHQFPNEIMLTGARLLVIVLASSLFAAMSAAQEAEWIWSPDHAKEGVPMNLLQAQLGHFAIRLASASTNESSSASGSARLT